MIKCWLWCFHLLLSCCISCWKPSFFLSASVFPCWFLLDKLLYHFVSCVCLHAAEIIPRGMLFVETILEVPLCLWKQFLSFLACCRVGFVTFSVNTGSFKTPLEVDQKRLEPNIFSCMLVFVFMGLDCNKLLFALEKDIFILWYTVESCCI